MDPTFIVISVFMLAIVVASALSGMGEYGEAYREGRKAGESGVPRKHNPYVFDPRLQAEWDRGYDDSRKT